MTSRKLLIIILIVAVIFASYFVWRQTRGQVGTVFGGRVISSIPCPCSGNFLLTISPPAGGQFVYYPGTQAYMSYNLGLSSGMWALGLYTPGGVCLVPAGKGCIPAGVPVGTITPTVGSSLIF